VLYYDQLWDDGLKYSNWIVNTQPWPDKPSPISILSGFPNKRDKNAHVFGAYCLFHVPKELRDGKFRPPSEMGIWVGLDPAVVNGHLVVPIEWQHGTQSWVVSGAVTATTVKVFDNIFPLKMAPPPGVIGEVKFDTFVNKVVNPLYGPESLEKLPEVEREPNSELGPVNEPEVEKITDTRMKRVGTRMVKQYHIKWVGTNEKSWEPVSSLNCPELVLEYNLAQTGRGKKDACSLGV